MSGGPLGMAKTAASLRTGGWLVVEGGGWGEDARAKRLRTGPCVRHTQPMELPPETGLIGMASWAVWKLIGPAAGEVAEASRRWTANRTRNIGRVLEMAAEEAGKELDRPGSVHPRVAHRLLEEGSYCDDEVMQRYLAGMLRASRTPEGQDDRAAYYVNVVASLTANQVRLHHAVYTVLADYERPANHDLANPDRAYAVSVRAPVLSAASLLGFSEDTEPRDAVEEALLGLRRQGLLGQISMDSTRGLKSSELPPGEPLFAAAPSPDGALLYLWGRGQRTAKADALGRTPLRRLDPPGPTLTDAGVGMWFPPPVDQENLLERVHRDQVMRQRLSGL
jgi:hypothetical protein